MPKYAVLAPIEHSGILFIPAVENPPEKLPTSGHAGGGLVAVDASGVIELTELEAAPMVHGALPLFQGKPDPIGGAEFRAKKNRDENEAATAKAAAEKAEYDEFLAFKAAKAAKKK